MNERFWKNVHKTESGCWVWCGPQGHNGYGMFWNDGRSVRAHRLSLEMSTGKRIPTGMLVLHKCDNPPCVNPDHLFLGTHHDNAIDAVNKGRWVNHIPPKPKRRTHCPHGHAMTEENVRLVLRDGYVTRLCIICIRESSKRHREKKRRENNNG